MEIEVGRLDVFVDDQIQSGARWENILKRKVTRSKLMIPLLSANYFHRPFCLQEMSLMFEREKQLNLIGNDENYGLLIPVRLGDGASFPDLIGRVQYHDFEDYADPDLPAGSARASEFNRNLKKLAKTIAQTLPHVPTYCDSWHDFTGNEFAKQLEAKPLAAMVPPRLIV